MNATVVVPEEFKSLFWDTDISKIEPEKHKRYIPNLPRRNHNHMFTNVLLDYTEKNIEVMTSLEFMNPFYLAGGTACAIHLGHRISYDLDFFSTNKFDTLHLTRKLKNAGDFITDYSEFEEIFYA